MIVMELVFDGRWLRRKWSERVKKGDISIETEMRMKTKINTWKTLSKIILSVLQPGFGYWLALLTVFLAIIKRTHRNLSVTTIWWKNTLDKNETGVRHNELQKTCYLHSRSQKPLEKRKRGKKWKHWWPDEMFGKMGGKQLFGAISGHCGGRTRRRAKRSIVSTLVRGFVQSAGAGFDKKTTAIRRRRSWWGGGVFRREYSRKSNWIGNRISLY